MSEGLVRKPRVGERLAHTKLDGRREVLRVTGFDTIQPNICHVELPDGSRSLFIWRFHDGLNNRVSHERETGR